jgi:hypothetical protein
VRIALELGLDAAVEHVRADLGDDATEQRGVDLGVDEDSSCQ